MDFRFTDAQTLLVNTAREFLRRRCPPPVVEESVASERGFSTELWKEISLLGWPGLLIPLEYGGSGGSLLDVSLLIEEMGRACFPSPYVQSAVVATSLLVTAANPAHVTANVTIAVSSSDTGEGTVSVPRFMRSYESVTVNGVLIVVTRGAAGPNLFLLETQRAGVAVVPMTTITGDRPCEVSFAGVETRADDLLGAAGQGWDLLGPALQAGALARTAEMVGCAQHILELCVEHAKARKQFGRPLGSFQAVQHSCADLLRNVEGARYLLYRAAWKMQEGRGAAADVAMAKAYAGPACQAVARRAHQLLGAISFCEEHPLHLFHKRILAASLDFGDPTHHLETVATSIGLQ